MTILAFLLWHKYYNEQTKFVVLLFVANAIYSFFYSFEISFQTLAEINLFYHFEYFGIPFLSTFYLMFALNFSGKGQWLTLRNKIALYTIPVITMAMVFTNKYHHLFYQREGIKLDGPFPTFTFSPAVWYYIHQGYVIVSMLFALYILGKMLNYAATVYRRQIIFLLVATIFPFIGYLAYQVHLIPFGIDPVSFTFTLTGIVVYYALVRLKLFELVPIARTKLFEKIQDRILVFDMHNQLIDYNLAASQQFSLINADLGKEIPELLGRWPEMMHFIQNNQSGKLESHHFEGGISYFYDIQILELENADKIENGKLVVIKDVSDLINSERERNFAASKLNAIIQAMPDIILVINSKGIFTDFFSSNSDRLFLTKEEVVGSSIHQLFDPEEASELFKFLDKCLHSNELMTHQFEMNFPGNVKHYEVRLSRLDKSHVLAIIRDVSESIEMKHDLLYQSGFQKILMKLASRFIYIAETEYDEVINDSLHQVGKYIGVDRAYIFRYNFEEDMMVNTHEWCSQNVEPLISKRTNISISLISDWVEKHKGGETTIIKNLTKLEPENKVHLFVNSADIKSIITIPMISQKNCLGFVGFSTISVNRKWSDSDIASLKIFTGMLANLQEKITIEQSLVEARIRAEASNKLKTAFMNNISHEIRTPLNGIIGFGEIIANEQLSLEEKNRFLTVVQESSERLIHTIDDYLDISMIVTGNQEINPKHFNLAQKIEEIIFEYDAPCHAKNISIRSEIPAQLKQTTIYSDPELIYKILNHLVGNALKFTERGSIAIGLRMDEDYLTLFVRDTGIGIAENVQESIFDSFMQEDFSSTRLYEGSGLGLSIVKGIVTLLGGKIKLLSNKGQGSVFNISLPKK
ncbi:MAG: ATP-binding protein [Prolixibacteraceae bacterium]|jgi:PAS domain S-box-containing protein|nr:ATP-binding protein [Prolixibacteraceae bacterium]